MRDKKRHNFVSAVLRYGITVTDFKRMFDEQDGVCAICHRPDPSGRRLSIDHDHSTLKVRGLLCCICNIGISCLDSDADWAIKALQYLDSNANITPTKKTTHYTEEWKEKIRQGNIRTWSDPRLRKKHEDFGKIGAKKQWAAMPQEQKEKMLQALQQGSKRFKLSMTEQQKQSKQASLRNGHRRWWESISEERRQEIASRVNKKIL